MTDADKIVEAEATHMLDLMIINDDGHDGDAFDNMLPLLQERKREYRAGSELRKLNSRKDSKEDQ